MYLASSEARKSAACVPLMDTQGRVGAALSVAAIRSRLTGASLQNVLGILHREARQLQSDLMEGA